MKRWIHSVSEPSSTEYGRALSEGNKRIQDRYEPFEVKETYFDRSSTSSTGYRIYYDGYEWIADNGGSRYSTGYTLYGPFAQGKIKNWSQLFAEKPIGQYKSLDNVMTYLFETVDVDM